MKLRAYAIIESFRHLDAEEKRTVLKALLEQTDEIEVSRVFLNDSHKVFFEFARKQWPQISATFFFKILHRWEILKTKSYGNSVIGGTKTGDLFLQSASWQNDNYCDYRILDKERDSFFFGKICRECVWKEMYICQLRGNVCQLYPIVNLMELNEEQFELKMKEYGYI